MKEKQLKARIHIDDKTTYLYFNTLLRDFNLQYILKRLIRLSMKNISTSIHFNVRNPT